MPIIQAKRLDRDSRRSFTSWDGETEEALKHRDGETGTFLVREEAVFTVTVFTVTVFTVTVFTVTVLCSPYCVDRPNRL